MSRDTRGHEVRVTVRRALECEVWIDLDALNAVTLTVVREEAEAAANDSRSDAWYIPWSEVDMSQEVQALIGELFRKAPEEK